MDILFYISCAALAVVAVSGGSRWILPIMAGAAFSALLTLKIQDLI